MTLYGPPIPLVAGRFLNVATLAGLLLYVTTYMATTLRRVATFKNNRQPAGIGRPYNDEYYHKIYRYMILRLGAYMIYRNGHFQENPEIHIHCILYRMNSQETGN